MISVMYKSRKQVEKKSLGVLRKDLQIYLKDHDSIYAKSFRRKVFLDKLPDAIIHRKKTRKKRLQCFLVACDILHNERIYTERINKKKQREFEIKGISAEGMSVSIHVREELSGRKNKKLFFISCFVSKK